MRYLFVFLTIVIGFKSTAQSKKEQIAKLNYRMDSLNWEYISDTTELIHSIETLKSENKILSEQIEEAQELIKKKSGTISEKTNTIESLNEKNLELMEDLKELRLSLHSMELENKNIKQALDSMRKIYPMVNRYPSEDDTHQPYCDEIEGLKVPNRELIPKDYTGVAFTCKDGKVSWLWNYKDGELYGLVRYWFWDNGQLYLESHYKDDKRDGILREWNYSGQLIAEKNYKDGELDGLYRYWHENGQLRDEVNYKNGKKDGLYRYWHENGQMRAEGESKEDFLNGLHREWHANGQLKLEEYRKGIMNLVSSKCWDEEGKEIECPEYR